MKCPFCGYEDSKVVDSRPTDEGTVSPSARMSQMPQAFYHLQKRSSACRSCWSSGTVPDRPTTARSC